MTGGCQNTVQATTCSITYGSESESQQQIHFRFGTSFVRLPFRLAMFVFFQRCVRRFRSVFLDAWLRMHEGYTPCAQRLTPRNVPKAEGRGQ